MAEFEEIKIRIVITGGGSGGHVFPLISVMEAVTKIATKKLLSLDTLYIGPKGFGDQDFKDNNIKTSYISAGKIRRYFSIFNFIDIFKVAIGFFQSLWRLWQFMPDIIFSKGGFGSVPVILAAKLLKIPLIVHESDSVSGLSNKLGAKFADRIAISFSRAFSDFPEKKTALTGNPIRNEMFFPKSRELTRNKYGFLNDQPLLFVSGGSQGATQINDLILNSLENLIRNRIQVFHQTGENNYKEVRAEANVVLNAIPADYRNFYQAKGFLTAIEMADLLSASDIVVARAGSGTIFEIAFFKKPSILIPLPESANDHQRINAIEYQKTGATIVLEGKNILTNLFTGELLDILKSPENQKNMSERAGRFSQPDAAEKIANEIFKLVGVNVE